MVKIKSMLYGAGAFLGSVAVLYGFTEVSPARAQLTFAGHGRTGRGGGQSLSGGQFYGGVGPAYKGTGGQSVSAGRYYPEAQGGRSTGKSF
jgi:hypothetical protein